MTYVVTFRNAQPSAREDQVWTDVRIDEGPTAAGDWTPLETQALSPVDTDPEAPALRDITTTLATLESGWYRLAFIDADDNVELTDPVSHDQAAYFTVAEVRARFPVELPSTGTGAVSDATLEYWREYVEDRIERCCDVAFVPRTVTGRVLSGTGTAYLEVPHTRVRSVTSVTDDGTTVDVDDALIVNGALYLSAGWNVGVSNLTVAYTHGYDEPPLAVKEAAMLWTREMATKGPITDRATQIPTESGASINLSVPGLLGSVTGFPAVDEVLNEYREPSFVG